MTAATRAFFHRHPAFAVAAVMVGSIALVESTGWLWLGCLTALIAGQWLVGRRLGVVCALAGVLGVIGLSLRHAARDEAAARLAESTPGETLELKMLGDARPGPAAWTGQAKIVAAGDSAAALVGRSVWVFGKSSPIPVSGTRILARGDFPPPRIARNPGEFDEAAWLRREGLIGVFGIRDGQVETRTSEFARWRAGIRNAFRESITDGLDENSRATRVIRAIVSGEYPRDQSELLEAFRHSGTLHVFSVSGMHVCMVGLLIWIALGRLGVPRRGSILLVIPLMFFYTWLTGTGAPAVRAACMASVFLGAFVSQRRPDALNALGMVLALMLLWDGRMLFQPGVQLSYGVVLAIIVGAAAASRLFDWMGARDAHLPIEEHGPIRRRWLDLRRKTATSLAVSTAAWAGSTPLTAFHFGLITPASIPATVVQIPIVFCLLGIALVSAILHPLAPWASRGMNHANALLAEACVAVASGFASIPGGNLRVDNVGARLIVYDLDYGAGAAVFEAGSHGATLIDCGSARSFPNTVLRSLQRLGIRPDSVILTHPDGGHLGGGAAVWDSLPIRQALLPVADARSPAYRQWLNDAPAAGVATGFGKSGQRHPLDHDTWIEVVHAPSHIPSRARADERVMILRLHWRGWRILFTSDAGMLTERYLLENNVDVAADVIVAGKHGDDLHLGDEFVSAVAPRAIVIQNTEFPEELRVPSSQLEHWKATGIEVLDSRTSGAATLAIDGDGSLRIRGFIDDREIVLPRDGNNR